MSYELIHNEAKNNYEYHIDGHVCYITYDDRNGNMHLTHTVVPKELGGRGIAKELLIDVLNAFKEQGKKCVAECTYVVAFQEKNSDYADYFAK